MPTQSAPGPISPDGELGFTNAGGIPTASPSPGVTFDPLGGVFPQDGYLGTLGIGNTLFFEIPNIADDRPVKHLRIQINGNWTAAFGVPTVVSLTGDFQGNPTTSAFVDSDETFPGFHRWEDWDIFPNPDFETLILSVPVGGFVNQVVIHTISTFNTTPPAGDYDGSGQVEQGDLDLVLQNWGSTTPPTPNGWINDLPIGQIDQAELDLVLQNWGSSGAPDFGGAVPEPASAWGLAALAIVGGRRLRRW